MRSHRRGDAGPSERRTSALALRNTVDHLDGQLGTDVVRRASPLTEGDMFCEWSLRWGA
jgi:hypothetical protein